MQEQHEVVIVGAGPTGTMLAIELGRRGVDVRLVERRESRLRHPRAIGIHGRSMEMLRHIGLSDDVRRAGGLPAEQWSSAGYSTRLRDPSLGTVDMLATAERVAQARQISPELIGWCAQDIFETRLRRHLRAYPTVSVHYGVRVTDVVQDRDGVTLTGVDEHSGAERTVRARYVVGADGGRSLVREKAGIPSRETRPLGHQINVCFEADLAPFLHGRTHILYWIINADTQGAFLTYDGKRRWAYSWGYDPAVMSAEDFTPEHCTEVIKNAIGERDVDIDIDGIFFWRVESALSDRYREGRLLLAGDAAHRVPPSGGFGMNVGLQDAQNLGWKLHAVLRGRAGDGLLDTYEAERRPIAEETIEQTLENARRATEVGWIMEDPGQLAAIEDPGPAGERVRRRIVDAVPGQEPQYWSPGRQFGFVYRDGAVVPDGTEPPASTVTEYHPSGFPGARAPHVWLEKAGGERVSTVDLLHTDFSVLAGEEGRPWVDAARRAAASHGVELRAVVIGDCAEYTEPTGTWRTLYGLEPSGAVVVRPDGHVGFRARALSDPATAEKTLEEVFDRLLALRP